jgi:hypothetical protein
VSVPLPDDVVYGEVELEAIVRHLQVLNKAMAARLERSGGAKAEGEAAKVAHVYPRRIWDPFAY